MKQVKIGTVVSVNIIRPSAKLQQQISRMVAEQQDYLVEADGVDGRVHVVVNDFPAGVWLCLHHDEVNMNKFTRLQRLDFGQSATEQPECEESRGN